jgi:hypothetical protein
MKRLIDVPGFPIKIDRRETARYGTLLVDLHYYGYEVTRESLEEIKQQWFQLCEGTKCEFNGHQRVFHMSIPRSALDEMLTLLIVTLSSPGALNKLEPIPL